MTDGEEARDGSEDVAGEVDSVGDTAREGVMGIGANGEVIEERSGVAGREIRVEVCARGDGDAGLESSGPRFAVTVGDTVLRVARAWHAADAAAFCAGDGMMMDSWFLAGRSVARGAASARGGAG